MSDFDQVRQAKALSSQSLLKRPNVVGVGVGVKTRRGSGESELSVVVLVRQKLPPAALSAEAFVPQEVAGVRTDVIEVGDLHALASFTNRLRPAPAGVSIGHYQITAGTLGSVVHDRSSGRRLILSNNHVLANCNQAHPGDPILQPGPADGGEVGPDTIGALERFIPLRFNEQAPICNIAQNYARFGNFLARLSGSEHQVQAVRVGIGVANHVDAALARPLDEDDLQERALEIGEVCGVQPASLGMAVCKSGRTTAFTTGTIQVLDSTVMVNYGPGRTATFEGQIVSTPMSEGGDSGSLLVTAEGHQAVGLLFGGSLQATLFNPIQSVLEALRIDLPGTRPASKLAAAVPSAEAIHRQPDQQSAGARAQAVRLAHEASLLRKANVVGVGVGYRRVGNQRTNQLGLVVLVERKLPLEQLAPEDRLPGEIDGVPVDVQEVGKLVSPSI